MHISERAPQEIYVLHLIVNRHNPESCAFRGDEEARLFTEVLDRIAADGAPAGVTVRESWIHRTGHELFVLVDAGNAHDVEELIIRSGLVARGHSRVLPVIRTADLQLTPPD